MKGTKKLKKNFYKNPKSAICKEKIKKKFCEFSHKLTNEDIMHECFIETSTFFALKANQT